MRKFLFVLMIVFGITAGIYLGLQYPPDIVCKNANDQAAPLPESTALVSSAPITAVVTPTPAAAEKQFFTDASNAPSATIAVNPTPLNNEQVSASNDILGQLMIGSDSISVRNNVDEGTLRQSPGWMPDSVLPGEDGMCVILGHRNQNHLKMLANVKVGDEIIFRYLDNRTATYTVKEIQIFEKTADWALPQSDGNLLVIVTCYPFRYSGSAPGKFQVVCKKG